MMRKSPIAAFAASFVTLAALPIASQATNGEFSHGFGVKSNALAGAGVAYPLDTLTTAINPATLAFVKNTGDVGVALFSPNREYTVTGGGMPTPTSFPPFESMPAGAVESDSNFFVVPSFGWRWPVSADGTLGIALYGNGGMNTDYANGNTAFGMGTYGGAMAGEISTGVDYAQLFVNLSYAHKLAPNVSIGASAILNYSMFEAHGLLPFGGFSTNPAALSGTGKDDDFGFGAKVGITGEVSPGVWLGASYQTKISNTMEKYSGLFANGGELDIPATATVGMAVKTSPTSVLLLDAQYIWYSDADAIGNSSSNLFGCMMGDPSMCLGGSNGAGFGWDDMWVLKAGYQWESGPMTWRVGLSYGDQPVQGGTAVPGSEVTFNILAPGVIKWHLTGGFSQKLAGNREWSLAAMYAPEECVSGSDLFTPGKTVEVCMWQFQLEAGYHW
jgi:long-chain fatty acid transport protein